MSEVDEPAEQKVAKPKRSRTSGAKSKQPFDPLEDPFCKTITSVLRQDPLPLITHRFKCNVDGEERSVGNMMFTLRRIAKNEKEEPSEINAKRLEYLSNIPRWVEFLEKLRQRVAEKRDIAGDEEAALLQQEEEPDAEGKTVETPAQTKGSSSVGLEGDIDKHAEFCLKQKYRLAIIDHRVAEMYLVIWESFPGMRKYICETYLAAESNKRARV